ncbi:hypothetical protein GCM10022199_21090 [Marihabitans asiaticum]
MKTLAALAGLTEPGGEDDRRSGPCCGDLRHEIDRALGRDHHQSQVDRGGNVGERGVAGQPAKFVVGGIDREDLPFETERGQVLQGARERVARATGGPDDGDGTRTEQRIEGVVEPNLRGLMHRHWWTFLGWSLDKTRCEDVSSLT